MPVNESKLCQSVLFFIDRAKGHKINVTSLWAPLFYLESTHSAKYGRVLLDVPFKKGHHGPEPLDADWWVTHWTDTGLVVERDIRRFKGVQRVLEAAVEFDLTVLGFSGRAVLEEVALHWLGATVRDIHSAVREHAAWKHATKGGLIDFSVDNET